MDSQNTESLKGSKITEKKLPGSESPGEFYRLGDIEVSSIKLNYRPFYTHKISPFIYGCYSCAPCVRNALTLSANTRERYDTRLRVHTCPGPPAVQTTR